MPSGVLTLPEQQLAPLERAYAEARAKKRLQTMLALGLLALGVMLSAWMAEVRPGTLLAHIDRLGDYIGRTFHLDNKKPVWTDPVEWYWGFWKWLKLIGETIVIAYLGTVIGGLVAFALSFLAASNLATRSITRQVVLRLLEFCRTVPELVFALLFVASFGLGPFAGVLALSIHTLGALGKQFCEVVENADMKPFDGVMATGATWTEGVRFAILPQVLPNFTSYGLMRFEINVRESAILGFVGAGGIGQELLVAVRGFYYPDVSAMVLMIVITVTLIDLMTEQLRRRVTGREHGA